MAMVEAGINHHSGTIDEIDANGHLQIEERSEPKR